MAHVYLCKGLKEEEEEKTKKNIVNIIKKKQGLRY